MKLLGKQQICSHQKAGSFLCSEGCCNINVWRIVSLIPSLTLSNINVSIPGVAFSVVHFQVNNTRWAGDYGQQHSWHLATNAVIYARSHVHSYSHESEFIHKSERLRIPLLSYLVVSTWLSLFFQCSYLKWTKPWRQCISKQIPFISCNPYSSFVSILQAFFLALGELKNEMKQAVTSTAIPFKWGRQHWRNTTQADTTNENGHKCSLHNKNMGMCRHNSVQHTVHHCLHQLQDKPGNSSITVAAQNATSTTTATLPLSCRIDFQPHATNMLLSTAAHAPYSQISYNHRQMDATIAIPAVL